MMRTNRRGSAFVWIAWIVALSMAAGGLVVPAGAQQTGAAPGAAGGMQGMQVASGSGAKGGVSGEVLAVITFVSGQVGVWRDGGDSWTMVQGPHSLYMGDHVRTGVDSRAVLEFTDGSEVMMNEQTTLQITPRAPVDEPKGVAARIKVSLGQIFNRVTPGQSDLEFETPDAVAAIRGTQFLVQTGPDPMDVRLSVLDGIVRGGMGADETGQFLSDYVDHLARLGQLESNMQETIQGVIRAAMQGGAASNATIQALIDSVGQTAADARRSGSAPSPQQAELERLRQQAQQQQQDQQPDQRQQRQPQQQRLREQLDAQREAAQLEAQQRELERRQQAQQQARERLAQQLQERREQQRTQQAAGEAGGQAATQTASPEQSLEDRRAEMVDVVARLLAAEQQAASGAGEDDSSVLDWAAEWLNARTEAATGGLGSFGPDSAPPGGLEQIRQLLEEFGYDDDTLVLVTEGQVDVSNLLGLVSVLAGQRTRVSAGQSPAEPVAASPEEIRAATEWVDELDEQRAAQASGDEETGDEDEDEDEDEPATDEDEAEADAGEAEADEDEAGTEGDDSVGVDEGTADPDVPDVFVPGTGTGPAEGGDPEEPGDGEEPGEPAIAVAVDMTVDPSEIAADDDYTQYAWYRITVTNVGEADLTDLYLQVELARGLVLGSDGMWAWDPSDEEGYEEDYLDLPGPEQGSGGEGGTSIWHATVASPTVPLAVDAQRTIEFAVDVSSAKNEPGEHLASAFAYVDEPEEPVSEAASTILHITGPTPFPDVGFEISVSPEAVVVGETVEYTVVAYNHGDDPVTDLGVRVTLPQGFVPLEGGASEGPISATPGDSGLPGGGLDGPGMGDDGPSTGPSVQTFGQVADAPITFDLPLADADSPLGSDESRAVSFFAAIEAVAEGTGSYEVEIKPYVGDPPRFMAESVAWAFLPVMENPVPEVSARVDEVNDVLWYTAELTNAGSNDIYRMNLRIELEPGIIPDEKGFTTYRRGPNGGNMSLGAEWFGDVDEESGRYIVDVHLVSTDETLGPDMVHGIGFPIEITSDYGSESPGGFDARAYAYLNDPDIPIGNEERTSIEVHTTSKISGRVTRGEAPLAGESVLLLGEAFLGGAAGSEDGGDSSGDLNPVVARATTDGNGRYEFLVQPGVYAVAFGFDEAMFGDEPAGASIGFGADSRIGDVLGWVSPPLGVQAESVEVNFEVAVGHGLQFGLEIAYSFWSPEEGGLSKVFEGGTPGTEAFMLHPYDLSTDLPLTIDVSENAQSGFLSAADELYMFLVDDENGIPLRDEPLPAPTPSSEEGVRATLTWEEWPKIDTDAFRIAVQIVSEGHGSFIVLGPRVVIREEPRAHTIDKVHVVHGGDEGSLQFTLTGTDMDLVTDVVIDVGGMQQGKRIRPKSVSVKPTGNGTGLAVDISWSDLKVDGQKAVGWYGVQLLAGPKDAVFSQGGLGFLVTSTDLSGNGPGVVLQRGDLHRSGRGEGPVGGLSDLDVVSFREGGDLSYWGPPGFIGDFMVLGGEEPTSETALHHVLSLTGSGDYSHQADWGPVALASSVSVGPTERMFYTRYDEPNRRLGAFAPNVPDEPIVQVPLSGWGPDGLLVHKGVLVSVEGNQLTTYDAGNPEIVIRSITLPGDEYSSYELAISTGTGSSDVPLIHAVGFGTVWTGNLYTLEELWTTVIDYPSDFAVSPLGDTLYVMGGIQTRSPSMHTMRDPPRKRSRAPVLLLISRHSSRMLGPCRLTAPGSLYIRTGESWC